MGKRSSLVDFFSRLHPALRVRARVRVRASAGVHEHTCIYACMHTRIHGYMHTGKYAYMHVVVSPPRPPPRFVLLSRRDRTPICFPSGVRARTRVVRGGGPGTMHQGPRTRNQRTRTRTRCRLSNNINNNNNNNNNNNTAGGWGW